MVHGRSRVPVTRSSIDRKPVIRYSSATMTKQRKHSEPISTCALPAASPLFVSNARFPDAGSVRRIWGIYIETYRPEYDDEEYEPFKISYHVDEKHQRSDGTPTCALCRRGLTGLTGAEVVSLDAHRRTG